ncbi:hypothetical protein L6452_39275 [Arctium lappa]|uniref:Uncharacterized protein n=1 Tax=Arctium lappa TaxID=4217 RepID=A0ACB8XT05_ARCLA|nr:hypothetical protein L6452_39275 [Arctium lappa]
MFKFKLSLSSFRLCRPKKSSSHFFSPFNPKVLEIAYPTTPSPPPTTPNHQPQLSKSKTKLLLVTTPEYSMHNSPVSFELTDNVNNSGHRKAIKKKKNKVGSSDESGWFSNSDGETESVISGSFDSCKKLESFGAVDENGGGIRMKKVEGIRGGMMLMTESLTVVKWSEKPFEDFKKSMLEMILEKEMVEAKDLEQLLQCFLSLNSRHHHVHIVAAFTAIWELLFL